MDDRHDRSTASGTPEAKPRLNPYLLVGLLVLLFVVFAGIVAFTTLRQRLGAGASDWTPPAASPIAGDNLTATAAVLAQATAMSSASATLPATPLASPTALPTDALPEATLTPTASPTFEAAACSQPVAPELAALYSGAELGCATGELAVVWAAWEPFERGAMLWRSDTNQSYVLLEDGSWVLITEPWNGQEPPGRGQPPAGRVSPERGFGWVWSTRDDIFQAVGWPTDREMGFCAAIQPFERGFLLHSSDVPSCTPDNLYNFAAQGGWRPLALAIHSGGWRRSEVPPGASVPASGTQSSTPGAVTLRPAEQGRFSAARIDVALDGSFAEWPENWSVPAAVVYGRDAWQDAADLGARFQLAWGADGLYLAMQVSDDVYRPGPDGSDMWQGDGLEINFDGQLAEDFASPEISPDDVQIGLTFGEGLRPARGYRWLPFDREADLSLPAVAVATQRGYDIEALLPWSALGLSPGAAQAGASFGFTVAVNDNDSDEPGQETVLSSSPARITYDNPTQWGTVTLE